jgi:Rad3-related DNA helicase
LIGYLKQTEVVDICPYHYLKYICNQVNLLLCPYNYILSPSIRKAMGINVNDAIIIFDEAHNIENVAEDCCSRELLIDDLMKFDSEGITDPNLKRCLKKLKNVPSFYWRK